MTRRTGRFLNLTWVGAAAALFTVTTLLVPALHFAYRNPALHITLNAVEAVIGLLVAYLAFGRFSQTGSWNDAALTTALGILGLTNLIFAVLPEVLGWGDSRFSTWAPLIARLVASGIFAGAALRSFKLIQNRRRTILAVCGVCAGVLLVVGFPLALWSNHLPAGVESSLPPDASRPHIESNPFVLSTQIAQMLFYAAAAVGFARRRLEREEEFLTWLEAAAILFAVSRLNYVLYPSLYTDFIYTGDILRLASYIALLVGGLREIQSYWRARADALVVQQRNLVARDLHDGLAQELTFLASQAQLLTKQGDESPVARRLATAADRAVAEARRAITALSRGVEETIAEAVAEISEEIARREGARVKLNLDPSVQVAPAAREAAVRVVREALRNAIKHSGSSVIEVTLTGEQEVVIEVTDAGRGFDPSAVEGGLGLQIMVARAKAVGGRVETVSDPGRGTTVKVVLPRSDK